LIEEPERLGKAAAVNRILSMARGDKVIFISADVKPEPNCLTSLVTAMKDPIVGISCGRPEPVQRGRMLVKGIVRTLWGFHNWQLKKLNHAGLLMHASEVFCIRRGIVSKIPRGIVNDDAFLAVAARNSGYKIKYVTDSRVHVFGPQTIHDYIKQRRRIIVGNYQVRKATGKFSQYLFYSLLVRPRLTLSILTGYFARTNEMGYGIAAGLIEIIANMLAVWDVMRGRSYAIWSISATTKTAKEL
jgi:cellulose synthase/poly-beta-1,6-N-acetylglucosamine synthase-like glycosyltransferase